MIMRLRYGVLVICLAFWAFLVDDAHSLIDGSGILLTPVIFGTGSSLAPVGIAGILYSVALIMIGLIYIKEPSEDDIYAEIYAEERKRKKEAQNNYMGVPVIPPWFYNNRYPPNEQAFYSHHLKTRGKWRYPISRRKGNVGSVVTVRNDTAYQPWKSKTVQRLRMNKDILHDETLTSTGKTLRPVRGKDVVGNESERNFKRRLDRLDRNTSENLDLGVFRNEDCRKMDLCLRRIENESKRTIFKAKTKNSEGSSRLVLKALRMKPKHSRSVCNDMYPRCTKFSNHILLD